jgi:hypothetical protein
VNLRMIVAATTATMAVAAPAAQACYLPPSPAPAPSPSPVDVCKLDVDALLAKYGSNLSAAQKASIVEAAKNILAAKGCAPTTPPVAPPPVGVPGYGV